MPALSLLDGRDTGRGIGCFSERFGARSRFNETKASVIAVMGELDRPVTSSELHAIWHGEKPLATFNYHLSTLVKAGVAEVVFGPELHFQLKPETQSLE